MGDRDSTARTKAVNNLDSIKARLLAAVRNGDARVTFGKVTVLPVSTGDFFRVEVAGDQPEGFKWDEAAQLAWWEGTLVEDAVEKVDAALKGLPAKGEEKEIIILARSVSLSDLVWVTKPYAKLSDAPANIRELDGAKLTLSQVNWIANMADGLKGRKDIESPWGVAIAQFKRVFKKEGDKWVKPEKKAKEMPQDGSVIIQDDGGLVFAEHTFGYDGEYKALLAALAGAQSHVEADEKLSSVGKALLPIADKGGGWDAGAAKARVAKWASSDGSGDKDKMDWSKYGRAFFYSSGEGNFGAFKLPFADVRAGALKAIPEGIYAAARAVLGARTPMTIPLEGPKARIAAYYRKMDEEAPWKREKELSRSALEQQIRDEFLRKFGPGDAVPVEDFYVREVFEDYLVAGFKGKLYRFPFAKQGEKIRFPFGEWEEVEVAYVSPVEEEGKEPVMKMALAVGKAMLKRQDSATTVWKEGDARYYMALVSMAIFDEEDQIVEKEGMDCSIALSQKFGYHSGLYIRHVVPESLVGRSMYERRMGPYWVEVGKFKDTPLADWTFENLEADESATWRLSIGFLTSKDQEAAGRYTRLLKYDTTITDRPALPVTVVLAVGGKGEMNALAKVLSFLNPESEEEKERATAMLGELFDLEEKELATVIKESEELVAAKAAISKIGDSELKARLLAVLGAAAEPKPKAEKKEELKPAPEPEPDLEPEPKLDVDQLISDAVTAAMTPLGERLTALEERPGATEAIKEISDLLRNRSQDPPKPSEKAPLVEGVDKVVKAIDKHIGAPQSAKHPLAGFAGGPAPVEGG